jgi:hypothetical protein
MKIRLKLENTAITATLDDDATSRDLVSLLPLTVTLAGYAATEKVSDLPNSTPLITRINLVASRPNLTE